MWAAEQKVYSHYIWICIPEQQLRICLHGETHFILVMHKSPHVSLKANWPKQWIIGFSNLAFSYWYKALQFKVFKISLVYISIKLSQRIP